MQAEFESRCEMYEAQVTKLQRSMERSDEDKAQVEEQLATAIALNHSGNKQVCYCFACILGGCWYASRMHAREQGLPWIL